MTKKGLITLMMCWLTTLLTAQEVITIQTHTQQKKDTLELKLIFDVAPGMHVYAPSSLNQSQGYIIMKLDIDNIPEGLKLLPGHQWPEPALSGGGEVYIGDGHIIICRLTGKAKRTPVFIKGLLSFQACNDEICFPPQEKEFSIELSEQKVKKKKR